MWQGAPVLQRLRDARRAAGRTVLGGVRVAGRRRGLRQEPRRHPQAGLPRQGRPGDQADQEPQRAPGAHPRTAPPVVERLTEGKRPEDQLLVGPKGGYLTTATVRDATNSDSIVAKLGLPDLTRHGIRHTGATWMADVGIPLHALQDILGHASIELPAAISTLTTDISPRRPSRSTPSSPLPDSESRPGAAVRQPRACDVRRRRREWSRRCSGPLLVPLIHREAGRGGPAVHRRPSGATPGGLEGDQRETLGHDEAPARNLLSPGLYVGLTGFEPATP